MGTASGSPGSPDRVGPPSSPGRTGLKAAPGARGVAAWIDVGLIGSLVAFAASVALQRIRTFDYWWHLRTGRLIAETGAVPVVDPYTYTVPGAQWIDVHWLHQLGLHALHSLGGHEAVTFAKLFFVLLLLGVLAVIGFRRERLGLTVLGLALVLLAAADRIMPRPELPSFVLLAAVLALNERFARRGDAWIYAVVPLQILWVNIHGLFATGLAVSAMYLVSELIRPLVSPDQGLRPARLRRLLSVLVLASLASLANPNFLDGALYPVMQLGMIGPTQDRGFFGTISELQPILLGSQPAALFLRSVFLGLVAISLAAMAANWRRMAASDPLMWAAFGYLALGAQRNVAFFAIVAVPIAVRNIGEVLDARGPRPASRRFAHWFQPAARALLACGLVALCVDTASGRFFARIGSSREPGLTPMELVYPIGAADWIAEHRPPGPICHHMADGGYLIWRLYPDYRSMTDGRLEVFGEERFAQLQVVNAETLRNLDEQYHFGVVLVHYSLLPSEPLLRWLYLSPRWRLVFVDDVAALFVRADSPGGQIAPEIDLDAPDLFPTLEGSVGWNDMARRSARVSFYSAMHRYEAALSLWQETLALYPDARNGGVVHASLLRNTGRGAAAEAILRSLLEARPKDPELHVQIGDLSLENSDRDTARRFFDSALALDAKLPLALLRRGEIAESDGDLDAAVSLYMRALAQLPTAHPIAVVSMTRLRAIDAGTAWLP